MSRSLRIEYPGAFSHAMNRGRRAEEIVTQRNDYVLFLELLKESSELFYIKIAAYCMMPIIICSLRLLMGICHDACVR